jgi:hypothetical protein
MPPPKTTLHFHPLKTLSIKSEGQVAGEEAFFGFWPIRRFSPFLKWKRKERKKETLLANSSNLEHWPRWHIVFAVLAFGSILAPNKVCKNGGKMGIKVGEGKDQKCAK